MFITGLDIAARGGATANVFIRGGLSQNEGSYVTRFAITFSSIWIAQPHTEANFHMCTVVGLKGCGPFIGTHSIDRGLL